MPPRRRRQRRKTWGGVGRPGNKALLMEKRETDCKLGTLRWHHRTSRRGATMRASSSHMTSPERDVRGARNAAWPTARSQRRARQHPATSRAIGEKDMGDGGRPEIEALFMVNREGGLRIGHAAWAIWDIAARGRARNSRCGMARCEIIALRAATPNNAEGGGPMRERERERRAKHAMRQGARRNQPQRGKQRAKNKRKRTTRGATVDGRAQTSRL